MCVVGERDGVQIEPNIYFENVQFDTSLFRQSRVQLTSMAIKGQGKTKNPQAHEDWVKHKSVGRPKQIWIESSFKGTLQELENLSDEEVLAIEPGHWRRV